MPRKSKGPSADDAEALKTSPKQREVNNQKIPAAQQEQTRYVLTLVPRPGVDGVYALRGLLKVAGRRFGLKAISVEQTRCVTPAPTAPLGQYDSNDDITKSVAEGFRAIRDRVAGGGAGWIINKGDSQ